MLELGSNAGFAQELLDLTGLELSLAGDFYRDGSPELGVAGLPYGAEASHAEPLQKLEMSDVPEHFRRAVFSGQAETVAAAVAGNIDKRRIGHNLERLVAVRAANAQALRTGARGIRLAPFRDALPFEPAALCS